MAPTEERPRVLLVDDDEALRLFVDDGLVQRGFAVFTCDSAERALEVLASESFDVVLSDVRMDGLSGIDLCRRLGETHASTPVIVVTAFSDVPTAVAAIRAGAYDFVTKPVDLDALTLTIDRALQHRRLNEEVTRLRVEVGRTRREGELLGDSPPMRKVLDLLDRIGDSDASVLVTGESGTGKELVARALHERGKRKNGAFVAVNCAAIPQTLLESELFGHAKGAFTDAKAARTGLLVQSSGGTLFLDEIGDMPLAVQPKLLRALQDRRVRPVGGDAEVPFDARVVAATHRDIESAVEEGLFREDLFFRINVIHVELPPLRSRGADVLMLAQRFVARTAQRTGKPIVGISAGAAERLLAYPWPGNVRELMNCVERAVALGRGDRVVVEDLPERIRDYATSHVLVTSDDPSELAPLDEVERRYVLRVLEAVGGNKSVAARVLGVDRKTLYRKLERYVREGAVATSEVPASTERPESPRRRG